MNPVFSCVANKVLLTSPGWWIAFDGITTCTYEIVLPGEFNDECVVIFFVKGLRIETCGKDWRKGKGGFFLHQSGNLIKYIMFFLHIRISLLWKYQYLLKCSVIETSVMRKIMNIGDDIGDLGSTWYNLGLLLPRGSGMFLLEVQSHYSTPWRLDRFPSLWPWSVGWSLPISPSISMSSIGCE